MEGQGGSLLVDGIPLPVEDLCGENDIVGFGEIGYLRLDIHHVVVLGGDEQGMTGKIQFRVGDNDVDIAEEAAARVPTRVGGAGSACLDGDDVRLAIAQLLRQVNLKAHVAIVGAAHALAIEIHIAHVHDALEVDEDALALERGIGSECLGIASHAHLLKPPRRQAALEVGSTVAIVGFLVGSGRHPRLLHLEVVWYVDAPPSIVFAGHLRQS